MQIGWSFRFDYNRILTAMLLAIEIYDDRTALSDASISIVSRHAICDIKVKRNSYCPFNVQFVIFVNSWFYRFVFVRCFLIYCIRNANVKPVVSVPKFGIFSNDYTMYVAAHDVYNFFVHFYFFSWCIFSW